MNQWLKKDKHMKYNISGVGEIEINTIVMDLNGTLAIRGKVIKGVKEKLSKLKGKGFKLILVSSDQRDNAEQIAKELEIEFYAAKTLEEKAEFMQSLNPENITAIGNAQVDIGLFSNAKLSIATLQAEGIHAEIIKHVDIIVPSIIDALNLLLDEDTVASTMKI